ncbi:MAG: YchE family NAAT transporter [Bdellovibrio sp.]|nr:MAG: YchE family NAAT transporter [Bdellovibrio sp.]
MTEWNEYFKVFIGLLAIINPLGAIPIFLAVTENLSRDEKKHTIRTTSVAVGIILLVSFFIGEDILAFFGINISSFRIAGGVLIFLMALSMLQGQKHPSKGSPEEKKDFTQRDSVAVVPLAIPLLSGPGAISTLIVYAYEYNHARDYVVIPLILIILSFIIFLTLKLATPLERFLGRLGINIMTRIMGLIIASIAVEFIFKGLQEFILKFHDKL